jgi:hypothetical protein
MISAMTSPTIVHSDHSSEPVQDHRIRGLVGVDSNFYATVPLAGARAQVSVEGVA